LYGSYRTKGLVVSLSVTRRPPTTWTQQICRDTGVIATEALELAEDKPFWRIIATARRFGWSLCIWWWWWWLHSCWAGGPLDTRYNAKF